MCFAQAWVGPVAGGCFFGFDEALVEQYRHSTFDAHVLAVAALAKHVVEFEHVHRLHAQFLQDALAVVAQTKSGLGDTGALQQLRCDGAACRVVQLEDPGVLGGG